LLRQSFGAMIAQKTNGRPADMKVRAVTPFKLGSIARD
jgi:hypothetical protein